MILKELLDQFDQLDRKGFYFSQIATSMQGLDEDEKKKPETFYEWVAFMLQPQRKEKEWKNFYYGPHFSRVYENGERIDTPSFNDINENTVVYWENRINQVKNPLLKMRYADLVWDFKKAIVKNGKRDGKLYHQCIESMLIVCDEDYCNHPVETVNVLERLFSVTKNKPADLEKTKGAYIRFENKHAGDASVRCWASRFLLMLENKNIFSENEVSELVKVHEERLNRISTPDAEGNIDPWLVEKQATLLADFYKSGNHTVEIKRVLNVVEKSFLSYASHLHPMQLMGNLENLYHKSIHYGLKEDADRLSIELTKIGRDAKDSMQTFEESFTIPKELFEQFEVMFGERAENDEERWTNFALFFIPSQDAEKEDLKARAKEFPFVYMMGTKVMDPKGRPMVQIGSFENDPAGNLAFHIGKKINFNSFAIRIALSDLVSAGCFTKEKFITNIISPSPLFEEHREAIIGKAVDYYLAEEYTTACHLLIPQIENAICNLVEMCGESVLKFQRESGNLQLRTLDELLRTESVKQVFSDDGAFYLRLVLTDQRALNLRNLLCHGILPPDYFGAAAADRLIHILVLLGRVRFVD